VTPRIAAPVPLDTSAQPHGVKRGGRAVNTEEITVGQLKRILRTATDEATITEAIEELAEADRRETAALEHGARLTAYNE
jgi:histone H3/H4